MYKAILVTLNCLGKNLQNLWTLVRKKMCVLDLGVWVRRESEMLLDELGLSFTSLLATRIDFILANG